MLRAYSRLLEQAMLVGDLVLVAGCWLLAYWLRFHLPGPPLPYQNVPPLSDYLLMLLPILVVWGVAFHAFGLYRPRRIGSHLSEAADVAKASTMGVLVLVAVMTFFFRGYDYSRVVIVYFWLLSIGLVWFSRAAFREALRFARRRGYDPLQDDDRLYLIKFNQAHHITVEDCELFDGKNFQRKPAIDLPCSDDVVVRRNLIRNCHRGVVSKGGGRRVLIEANVFVDNSGAAFSGGSTDPDLFIDGRFGDPCSFAFFESYDMTARDNLVVSTRPGERPVEPVSIWAVKNASIVNNTFIGIGERGVLLVRPGNEVDSPAKGCGRSVRLMRTEDLTLKSNIFILSGVVDETMLYQTSGVGTAAIRFDHRDNTFFNSGHDVPVGGLADPNGEPGFSKSDPQLAGGQGTDYATWMAAAKLKSNSSSLGRGVRGAGK